MPFVLSAANLPSGKSLFFVTGTSYGDRQTIDALKTAGFKWHGDFHGKTCQACQGGLPKVWYTDSLIAASKFRDYADENAKTALGIATEAIEASRAKDADIEIPVPVGLSYLPFQKAGIKFMAARNAALLADAMGLGKTIQVLGLVNLDESIKSVLIVCPATLRLNWAREAGKWLVRPFNVGVVETADAPSTETNFVIVNFERVRDKKLLAALMARKWDLVAIDEGHRVKNPKAQQTVAVLGKATRGNDAAVEGLITNARRKVILTGTPLPNRTIEVQPLLGALVPETFGNFFQFGKRFADAYQDKWGWHFDGSSNLDELQTQMRSSVMIRRLKEDVLTELPAKRRQVVALAPNGAAKLIEQEKALFNFKPADTTKEGYEAAVSKLSMGSAVDFEEMSRIRHELALTKVPKVIEYVQDMFANGVDKIFVAAHHRDLIELIAAGCPEMNPVTLTGDTSMTDRQTNVDKFQNDSTCRLFVGSIIAAGVGITLTASSHVVFAELDWVPGNVTQTEDRCHRIGQRNSVNITHLLYEGSLDAYMAAVLIAKQEVQDAALDIPVDLAAKVELAPELVTEKVTVSVSDKPDVVKGLEALVSEDEIIPF